MDSHSHPEIIQMQVQLATLTTKVDHLERVIVIGSDGQLPLPEVVHSLASTVDTYIKRKDQEELDKKREWSKWRWAVLGTVIPGALIFIAQATIFFFRFVPIMVSLSQQGTPP